jgi:hypothetical protein
MRVGAAAGTPNSQHPIFNERSIHSVAPPQPKRGGTVQNPRSQIQMTHDVARESAREVRGKTTFRVTGIRLQCAGPREHGIQGAPRHWSQSWDWSSLDAYGRMNYKTLYWEGETPVEPRVFACAKTLIRTSSGWTGARAGSREEEKSPDGLVRPAFADRRLRGLRRPAGALVRADGRRQDTRPPGAGYRAGHPREASLEPAPKGAPFPSEVSGEAWTPTLEKVVLPRASSFADAAVPLAASGCGEVVGGEHRWTQIARLREAAPTRPSGDSPSGARTRRQTQGR